MKLELKSVKFSEAFSEETNCFTADLFANGKKIAYVKNDGHGGCTFYNAYPLMATKLVEAEQYALSLPEINCGEFSIKSNLEHVIDDLFEKWLDKKEAKKLEKNFEKGICYGSKNCYNMHYWKGTTLKEMLNNPIGVARVKKVVADLISQNKTILNTNLPLEILNY